VPVPVPVDPAAAPVVNVAEVPVAAMPRLSPPELPVAVLRVAPAVGAAVEPTAAVLPTVPVLPRVVPPAAAAALADEVIGDVPA
jgi:hypothetical protein